MSDVSREAIEKILSTIVDPHTTEDLVTSMTVKNITVDGDKVSLRIVLGYPAGEYMETMKTTIVDTLKSQGIADVELDLSSKVQAHMVQNDLTPLENVKNIIAIASGKGGVGKSTTTVNLALALQQQGATVGILDADIYGPSQPRMMGLSGRPESEDGKFLEPMVNYGIQTMSIGYLIEEDTPMIWRGPMVTQALQQLLTNTNWKELDYLLIDMPPGTGDIALTLAQQVPVSGAVIVTTPQDIALLDARKGLKMFEKVDVPVLGIVENMSVHICSQCQHEEPIFGTGGGQKMADEYKVDMLGALPLDMRIRKETDDGKPTVVADSDSRISEIYRETARNMVGRLSVTARNMNAAFPNIVIQNT
ncbi:MAG: iron-sulfur cluster carrier protein ApbC [bacterium]